MLHPKSSIGLRVVFQFKVQMKNLGNDDKLKEAWSFKTRAYKHCAMGEKTTKLIE